ncbi:MAG: sugar ABC transporter ATP-binding protein, partial [Pygmaiobacter sp.]
EFSLIPTMSVVENLFLGREHQRGGLIDEKRCDQEAREIFSRLGIEIDPLAAVENLSIGNQQLVEIAKALMQNPTVLILDEPTASLTHNEIELLFRFMRRLKENGIAIILISHHMQEIMEICDRAIVLRGGLVEMNERTQDVSVQDMINAMIGRSVSAEKLRPASPIDYTASPLLEVRDVSWNGRVNHASFCVYPREVIGIAGLLGSGRTELLKCIYGLIEPQEGEIELEGTTLPHRRDPSYALARGICFVPENRRVDGIVPTHTIEENMLISTWREFTTARLIDDRATAATAQQMVEKLSIKCTGVNQEVQNLSGGNQQKVVFGKSIFAKPRVMLLDDPTVGIDVEAKDGIATIVRNIADAGSAVVLVSSEIDQLEKLCDRVLIIREGQIVKELRHGEDDLSETAITAAIQI